MQYLKQTYRKLNIDPLLVFLLAGVLSIAMFGLEILQWVCTHNVLKGQW